MLKELLKITISICLFSTLANGQYMLVSHDSYDDVPGKYNYYDPIVVFSVVNNNKIRIKKKIRVSSGFVENTFYNNNSVFISTISSRDCPNDDFCVDSIFFYSISNDFKIDSIKTRIKSESNDLTYFITDKNNVNHLCYNHKIIDFKQQKVFKSKSMMGLNTMGTNTYFPNYSNVLKVSKIDSGHVFVKHLKSPIFKSNSIQNLQQVTFIQILQNDFISGQYMPLNGSLKKSYFFTLNRATDKLDTFIIDGNSVEIQRRGDYIVSNKGFYKEDRMKGFNMSQCPKKFDKAYFFICKYKLNWTENLFYTGHLILVRLKDNTMIEFQTGAADSEIIQVHENTVFYRIEDKLYKAPILEKSIGTPEFIVQHPLIFDTHYLLVKE